jgi:hypothetical protein
MACLFIGCPSTPAQDLPPLKLTASVNEGTHEVQQTVGFGAYVALQVRTQWQAAGTWCIPVADVRVTDPAFFAGVAAGGWEHEFAVATTPITVADLLGGMTTQASSTLLAKPVAAHPVDFGVLPQAIGLTPTVAILTGDPLYLAGGPGVHLVQALGTNLWPDWQLDPSSPQPIFNLDSILQATAWKRLAGHPSMAGVTAAQYFESAAWTKLLFARPTLSLTTCGLRGGRIDPRTVPPPGTGLPAALNGYPNVPPRCTVAPPTKITVQFVGSGLSSGRPRFFAPGGTQPALPPTASVGGAWFIPIAGFAPGLQLAVLHKTNGQRLESTVQWAGFGDVTVPVPSTVLGGAATPLGLYEVTAFRYALVPPATGYGPWQTIPAAERLTVKVL